METSEITESETDSNQFERIGEISKLARAIKNSPEYPKDRKTRREIIVGWGRDRVLPVLTLSLTTCGTFGSVVFL